MQSTLSLTNCGRLWLPPTRWLWSREAGTSNLRGREGKLCDPVEFLARSLSISICRTRLCSEQLDREKSESALFVLIGSSQFLLIARVCVMCARGGTQGLSE